jgi:FKBP-type peptidyl-prolyl cis-trans isomerase FkpA
MYLKIATIFFSLLFLFSCGTYSESDKNSFDKKIKNFLSSKKEKYTKSESGLYYYIEEKGSGDAIKLTDKVSFMYEGRLLDGTVFDGQFKKRPTSYQVSALIQAWQEAMLYSKKGTKIHLVCPPQLGYGDYDLEAIPKNSILVFDMEIVEVL